VGGWPRHQLAGRRHVQAGQYTPRRQNVAFRPNWSWREEVVVEVINPALATGPELEKTVRWLGIAKFG
jgi:hypothetical protein